MPARLASLVFQIVSLVIALLYAHQQVCKIVVTGVISSNKHFQFKFQFNFASWKRLIFIIHFKILIILSFNAFKTTLNGAECKMSVDSTERVIN